MEGLINATRSYEFQHGGCLEDFKRFIKEYNDFVLL
jgi:hypothetical protein